MLMQTEQSQILIVDVQERLAAAMNESDAMVRHCGLLIDAARLIGVPVTISEQYPQGLGPTVPALSEKAEGIERFAKVEFSCLRDAAIRTALRSRSRGQLIIGGIEAHVCVLQTAVDAKADGFDVFVVADATTSRKAASRDLALQRLAASGVTIVTAEMVIFEWAGSAGSANFKPLSKLVR